MTQPSLAHSPPRALKCTILFLQIVYWRMTWNLSPADKTTLADIPPRGGLLLSILEDWTVCHPRTVRRLLAAEIDHYRQSLAGNGVPVLPLGSVDSWGFRT